ncbi:hypothetical protein SAMN06264364_14925 [Quadrisphaera granulorum]|uniref:Tetratricopeptide repeat protein n=1 Tax=Quadrisphaera granulorum TaxID=317664 RepID=A0A315ZM28_9ACTN|nr:hypothetical protein [Quadrisphaera granulorum]PWJ46289.1 hypothetical protein BXY45_14925 [Quadrisphaera granulorum]SZE99104.1 hypothetical protein SAMN06264364_14925 [Quadrisphaera granulorum]
MDDETTVRAADAELTIQGWANLLLLQAALGEGNVAEAKEIVEQAMSLWRGHPWFDDIDHEAAQRLQDMLNSAERR